MLQIPCLHGLLMAVVSPMPPTAPAVQTSTSQTGMAEIRGALRRLRRRTFHLPGIRRTPGRLSSFPDAPEHHRFLRWSPTEPTFCALLMKVAMPRILLIPRMEGSSHSHGRDLERPITTY